VSTTDGMLNATQNHPPHTPDTHDSAEEESEPEIQPTIERTIETGLSATGPASTKRPKSTKPRTKARAKTKASAAKDTPKIKVMDDESDDAEEENEGNSDSAGPSKVKSKVKKRDRAATPPDYAKHMVETATVRMDFLTKETRYGAKSKREAAMQKINWDEVKQRKKAEALEAAQSRENPQETHAPLQPAGPQLRLDAHGNILVDQASLAHDRTAAAMADVEEMEILEEDDLTNRITTQSLTMAEQRDPHGRSGRGRGERWTHDETELFFQYLGMFGTDFMIISTMFPQKTRRQIKMKFTREERCNAARVKDALIHGTSEGPGRMDFETYKTATGKTDAEFRDARALEKELLEERERERLNIERAKREHQEKQRQAQAHAAEAGEKGAPEKGKRKEKGKKNTPAPAAMEENVEVLEEFDD
jgi:transcription factor TFIIIB component B''